MQNFSKNKGFYTLIISLILIFAMGVTLCILTNNTRKAEDKKLSTQLAVYKNLLRGQEIAPGSPPVSLTPANVNASTQDYQALLKQRDDLRLIISAPVANRIQGKENLASSDLASSIKQNVDEWTRLAVDKDIRMFANEKCEFGFRRYIHNPGTSPKGQIYPRWTSNCRS
jgi:hypothetical protein